MGRVRVVEFELSSSNCRVRVGEFELSSSSWRVRVGEFESSSSSCRVRVGEFDLASSSRRVVECELASSSWLKFTEYPDFDRIPLGTSRRTGRIKYPTTKTVDGLALIIKRPSCPRTGARLSPGSASA